MQPNVSQQLLFKKGGFHYVAASDECYSHKV